MAVPGGTLLSTVNQNGLPSTSAAKSMQSDSIFAIFFGSKFATTMTVLFNNSSGSKKSAPPTITSRVLSPRSIWPLRILDLPGIYSIDEIVATLRSNFLKSSYVIVIV